MYPTLFKIPFLPDWLADVKSYGVAMTIAFLSGIWMACRRADRTGGNADVCLNIGFIALLFGVAGARAMFVIHYWDTRFANQPNPIAAIFDIRAGGLEFWGGPLLTIPALIIYLKYIAKVSARWYLDMTAPSLAWGLAITRIGCFMNGCCWGATCVDPAHADTGAAKYPWAVRFPYGSPAMAQQFRFGQLTLPKELILQSNLAEVMPYPREFIDEAAVDNGETMKRLQNDYQTTLTALQNMGGDPDSPAYQSATKAADAARNALSNYSVTLAASLQRKAIGYDITPRELAKLADHYRSKPVHPTQLYEMVSAMLICWVLSRMYYYRRRHGVVLPWFLLMYSVSRVVHESLRQDNPLDVGGVTISQAISAMTFAIGLLGLWWLYARAPLTSPRAVQFIPPPEATPVKRTR